MDIKPNFISFFFTFLFLSSHSVLIIFGNAHGCEVENENEIPYSYIEGTGKGPSNWSNLNPDWKVCNAGKLQSPIDLVDTTVQVVPDDGELKRGYKPAPAILKNRGHDIAVEWTGDAGLIVANGTEFKLLQCHWHTPSEHSLNGKRYDLEFHIVHEHSGGNAVVGILYELGQPDPFLAKFVHHIRNTKPGGVVDLGIVSPDDISFETTNYYRYIGSLTTPPCREGVVWTILKKVGTVSSDQISALKDAVQDGFEANARPMQQQNGRPVYFYTPRSECKFAHSSSSAVYKNKNLHYLK